MKGGGMEAFKGSQLKYEGGERRDQVRHCVDQSVSVPFTWAQCPAPSCRRWWASPTSCLQALFSWVEADETTTPGGKKHNYNTQKILGKNNDLKKLSPFN